MTNKPIIAVDADDTLFDENNAVRLFHNEKYGTNHTAEDYLTPGGFEYYWEKLWGTTDDETLLRYEEFVQWKLEHNLPPLPGALEVLTGLQHRFELVVITMRDKRSVEMTHQALNDYYPDVFKDVHFAPLWGGDEKATKAKICNEIGATYLVDDGLHHCELAAEAGVEALLFGEYGWNSNKELAPNITRVKDWQAVQEYFDARG